MTQPAESASRVLLPTARIFYGTRICSIAAAAADSWSLFAGRPTAARAAKLPNGRDRLVRHGHGPTRTIQTGIGPPWRSNGVKIRDRGVAADGERVRFMLTSHLLA